MAGFDRVRRLLQLLEILQSERPHNARELAEMCGVSRRTIFRYINILQESGIHVFYSPDVQGYHLPADLFLPPTTLTLAESLAVVGLCYELAGGDTGIPFHEPARTAALKLLSNLPRGIREQLNAVSPALTIRMDAHNPLAGSRMHYDLFMDALAHRNKVRIVYKQPLQDDSFCTVLQPYRVIFSRRSWYVIGRSSLHRAVRTFHVGRVQHAEMLGERYAIPPRFSLERYLGNAWHLIRESGNRQRVVVRFQKMVAQNVAEVHWHKTQKVTHNDDGSIDFQVTVDGLGEISWWILGYGDQAEVLAPEKLRKLVADRVRNMSKTYARPATAKRSTRKR